MPRVFHSGSVALIFLAVLFSARAAPVEVANARLPNTDTELRYWLENMVWYHDFTSEEIRSATGLSLPEISTAERRLRISETTRPKRPPNSPLLTMPYPGGRHPRIGFLDGAVNPQRETKVSVFTPWDERSYVVVDVPEAIWSNLGLTYLAHTHVPTIWSKQNINLDPLEWTRHSSGLLEITRTLPNAIAFGAKVYPLKDGVIMEMWLTNGTPEKLTDLRVQNCVMLKGAIGFENQSNSNKVILAPYVACRSEDAKRWIISAWQPCHHPWANAPVPCLHSDPKFPDCLPGETKRLRGWLSFYEGTEINREFERLNQRHWDEIPFPKP
jgi:hypothetical protein